MNVLSAVCSTESKAQKLKMEMWTEEGGKAREREALQVQLIRIILELVKEKKFGLADQTRGKLADREKRSFQDKQFGMEVGSSV